MLVSRRDVWLWNNLQNHLLFWEFSYCSCFHWSTACRAELEESTRPQPCHHSHSHRSLSVLSLPSESREKGVICCRSPEFYTGTIHYNHVKSLSSFPKEQHLKELRAGLGNTLSLSCLCTWVQCFWWGGWHSCLKLNRTTLLWVSLKLNFFFFFFFFPAGREEADLVESKI